MLPRTTPVQAAKKATCEARTESVGIKTRANRTCDTASIWIKRSDIDMCFVNAFNDALMKLTLMRVNFDSPP